MKSVISVCLFLCTFFILHESCYKNDHGTYNPYSISEEIVEQPVDENSNLTSEEALDLYSPQIIDGMSFFPDLLSIFLRDILMAQLDSLSGQGNQAVVRNCTGSTDCPCTANSASQNQNSFYPYDLVLNYDDCVGGTSLGKKYDGDLTFTFQAPVGNPFTGISQSLSLTAFQDFTFTGTGANAISYKYNSNNASIGFLISNTIASNGGSEIEVEHSVGTVDYTTTYDIKSVSFTVDNPAGIAALLTMANSPNDLTLATYFMEIDAIVRCTSNGGAARTFSILSSTDPLVIQPSDCGCYKDGTLSITESGTTETYDFGDPTAGACDSQYITGGGVTGNSAACDL